MPKTAERADGELGSRNDIILPRSLFRLRGGYLTYLATARDRIEIARGSRASRSKNRHP
jgi:hypothetical protein